jgi:TRAP-type C4-dicarboxylate transport system permease small subunit
MTVVSAAGIMGMILVTTADVVARAGFGRPLSGAFDIVGVLGGLTLFCALPYTTAVKGHVAVEFLFHKLGRRGRILVDVANRLLGMALFAGLAVFLGRRALALRASGTVTPTLQLPMHPVVWIGAVCAVVVMLVILHNMLRPGKEMIRL